MAGDDPVRVGPFELALVPFINTAARAADPKQLREAIACLAAGAACPDMTGLWLCAAFAVLSDKMTLAEALERRDTQSFALLVKERSLEAVSVLEATALRARVRAEAEAEGEKP